MIPTLPSSMCAFPATDALLQETSVLIEAYEVALDLGAALRSIRNGYYVEDDLVIHMSALHDWEREATLWEMGGPRVDEFRRTHARLSHMRQGYRLLVEFTRLVKHDGEEFPSYFVEQLERLARLMGKETL